MNRVAFAFAFLAAFGVHADEGEILLGLRAAPEVEWVSHPVSKAPSPFDPTSSFALAPRLGIDALYGLTNSFQVGLGANASFTGALTAKSVTLQGATGDLVTASRVDVFTPLVLAWRIDDGFDFTGDFELAAGPYAVLWAGNGLGDPTDVDPATKLPRRFDINIPDEWDFGARADLSAFFQARFLDFLVIDVGPYAGVSFAGTLGVHAGVVLRPSLVLGLGPL